MIKKINDDSIGRIRNVLDQIRSFLDTDKYIEASHFLERVEQYAKVKGISEMDAEISNLRQFIDMKRCNEDTSFYGIDEVLQEDT